MVHFYYFIKVGNKQCYSNTTIAAKKREGPGNRCLHGTNKGVVHYTMLDSSNSMKKILVTVSSSKVVNC